MTDTLVKFKSGGSNFETMVDLDLAMKLKKGEDVNISELVRDNNIYNNLKKGMKSGNDELMNVFETTDFSKIVEKIVKKGHLEVTQEYREEELEAKKKQVVEFLIKNALNSKTGQPFSRDLIISSIKESGMHITNRPTEEQIPDIIETLKKVLPIKLETKKLKIKTPAQHTGRVYGLFQKYKEKENWLPDGSLEVILNIPKGIQSDFYDKLNSITHGSAITSEIKDE